MKKMKIFAILFFLSVLFSCQEKNNTKELNLLNSKIGDSAIVENKNYFKEKIFNNYNQVPLFLFAISDGKDHSKYEEFIALQSSIKDYRKLPLTDMEIQRLGILNAKALLIVSDYESVIDTLDDLPLNKDFEIYKTLLKAIALDYNGIKNEALNLYEKLLFELGEEEPVQCNRYFIVAALAQKRNIQLCKDQQAIYKQLIENSRENIIKTYILSEVEL